MQLEQQESKKAIPFAFNSYSDSKTPGTSRESGEVLRVTPEEVALAAAALEAKRDAEHVWHTTTLPLDQAINHLGLNAAPHELAPEVVLLRAERAAKVSQEQKKQQASRFINQFIYQSVGLAIVGLLVLVGTVWYSLVHSRNVRSDMPMPLMAVPIQKLALIADNMPVHIDADTLARLAKGEVTPEEVSVDTRTESSGGTQSATMFNNEWTLVKSDGAIFVRGWATVEFALNISNNSTGALFSNRPSWLPVNNIVPLQVPVYRLEKQTFAHYLSTGKQADTAANSVLVAVNVASSSAAISDLVQDDILSSNENFISYSYWDHSDIQVAFKNNIVHLTGNATTLELKTLAGVAAAKSLKRLHVSGRISNELKIAPVE